MEKRLFTSESVTEGHPDKVCDAISDAILDACMAQDPMSRVACETCTTTDLVMVMGEITTKADIDVEKIVREAVTEIGYTKDEYGFNADTCKVMVVLDKQSTDIAMGVDKALEAKENTMSDSEIEAIIDVWYSGGQLVYDVEYIKNNVEIACIFCKHNESIYFFEFDKTSSFYLRRI